MFSNTWRWISAAALAAAAALAGWTALELLDDSSRGVHLAGPLRWPGFAAMVLVGGVNTAASVRDAWRGRVPARVGRDLLVLSVLGIAAQVVLLDRFDPFQFRFVMASVGSIHAVLRLGDSLWTRLRSRRWMRGVESVAFMASVMLVSIEIGLRLVAAGFPSPLFARDDQGVDVAIAINRFEPGTLRFGFRCNSGGYYDEEFAPTTRTVLSVGDSFSVGVVPHRYHFTTVCERELPGTTVHNLGHSGIGPGGYLHLLREEGIGLAPDLVVVNVFVGNDLYEASRWNDPRGLLRSICDRRNLLSYQVPARLLRLAREAQRTGAFFHQFGERLGQHLLAEPTEDPAELARALPWLDDALREEGTFSEEEYVRIEAERAQRIHLADRHGWYDPLFAALEQMVEAAAPVPVAVMLIPDEFQVDEQVWQAVQQRLGSTRLDRDQPQKRIAAWLDARAVPYLDLLPVLRAVPPLADGRRHLYHLRDTHFNRRGNEATGAALAGFLRERFR